MPKIDREAYEAATETTGGGIAQMTPGAYVLKIVAIRTEGTDSYGRKWTSGEKQYVKLVYDVAEGDFEGRYSEPYFIGWDGKPDPDKDYAHCDYLSWKNLGFLKHKLNAITASNPGFDALAAFEADKWDMFVGKVFGAVIDGEVDTNDRGYDRWRLSIGEFASVQDARSGNVREPKVKDNRGAAPAPASTTGTAADYSDVPFSV